MINSIILRVIIILYILLIQKSTSLLFCLLEMDKKVNVEETQFPKDGFMSERMDLEKIDYPVLGANRNHTSKPPQRD
ncbi:hypothetical protein Hanom_Chr16g01421021 [Helianthus anomalus]